MKEGRFEWMERSACGPEHDVEFFLQDNERLRDGRFDAAKALCASCPVKKRCDDHRLSMKPRPSEGVWAGKVYLPRSYRRKRDDEQDVQGDGVHQAGAEAASAV